MLTCVSFFLLKGEMLRIFTLLALLLREHVWWEILDGRLGAVDGKVFIAVSSDGFATVAGDLSLIIGFGFVQRVTLIVDTRLVVDVQSADRVISNSN